MLSKKEIICPDNLLKIAKTKGPVKAVIVNAVKMVAIQSAQQAVEANLIIPVFVGDKTLIQNIAKEINWDISKYEIIHEPVENNTAPIAAKLASEGNCKRTYTYRYFDESGIKEKLKFNWKEKT